MATAVVQVVEVPDCLPRAAGPAPRRQQRILLIEDSEDAMLLVQYALHEYGHGRYRLEWASSLNDGLDHLSRGGIDLVVLDLGLPESSGPESYAWVREIDPEVPVVVLTGDATNETELSLIRGGAEDYLVKERISGPLLLQAIRAALFEPKRRQHPKPRNGKFVQRFRWTYDR